MPALVPLLLTLFLPLGIFLPTKIWPKWALPVRPEVNTERLQKAGLTPGIIPTPQPTSTPVLSPSPGPTSTSNVAITPSPVPTLISTPVPTFVTTSVPTSVSTPVSTIVPTSGGPPGDFLMAEINNFRRSKGLASVSTDPYTCNFAGIRVKEISASFNHDGFTSRLNSHTLPYSSYRLVVENIAKNGNFQDVVKMWINSPGHAKNLLADVSLGCIENSSNYFVYEGWKP